MSPNTVSDSGTVFPKCPLILSFTSVSGEVKRMNAKVKGALVLSLVLLTTAAALYVFPASAAMNGDTDQIQDRDTDRLQDRECLQDCSCDCLQDQTRIQTRLHTRGC